LGAEKSHLAFTNEDFDQVAGCIPQLQPAGRSAGQLRQLNQPRIRLKYAINALAPAAGYWSRIARDKFGTDDLDALSIEQLTQLRKHLEVSGPRAPSPAVPPAVPRMQI